MTVSLDTPLRGGTNEGRQRIVRGLRRGAGFIGRMARNPLTAIGGGIIGLLLVVAIFRAADCPLSPAGAGPQ
ncbi:Uncharacterised protein [Raoultella terrigena]|nr:Uncharacterised protein [Raoultella terrigena]